MSRTTITDFFQKRPIGEPSFRKICLALLLNWEQVSSDDLAAASSNNQPENSTQLNETFIRQVRDRCRQKILERYSRIRLLSGQEIGVDQLYVDVWLLGKPERKHFNTQESLLESFDIKKDRLALSKRIQRNPGFEIANRNSKLVILGKPGSGKTTFLKHLAVDWCKGEFQPEKICILIELRRIREEEKEWNLIEAIGQELELKEEETLSLLKRGNLLVLMDGLDEIPTRILRRHIQSQVREVSEKYFDKNRFTLTCRTQIMGIIPSGFTSVEVADFNSEQVRKFVRNWFIASGQPQAEATKQWEKIQHATINQPDFKELTATPVLLSLICVILQDSGEIPTDRTTLYKNNSPDRKVREIARKAIQALRFC